MTDTKEFWAGKFGDEYTKRNRVDWRKRIPFWDRIVQITGIRSAFEIGCNAGWNLSAIKHSMHGYNVVGYGCDLNVSALRIAGHAHLDVYEGKGLAEESSAYELVFTSGVLIHVAPEDLPEMMKNIIRISCDYVLAIEYEDDFEVEVEYRGHSGKLWRRPYGKLYEEMGLQLVEYGKLGGQDGFDPNGVSYWLLRK